MSASARVVTAVVMASAIATAVALPAIVGGHGHAHVVAAPESAGRRTVRIEGPATSSVTARPRTPRRQPDVAARRMPHADARLALAAVSYRRPSTPSRPAAGRPPAARPRPPAARPRPPAARPRPPAPAATPAPRPNPPPVPQTPTPAPPPTAQPPTQPPSQPAAPVTQLQGRELASAATPNPPPGGNDDQGHDDDRGARHQDERSRDDAPAGKHDHKSGRDE
jgi:hypothetical protein